MPCHVRGGLAWSSRWADMMLVSWARTSPKSRASAVLVVAVMVVVTVTGRAVVVSVSQTRIRSTNTVRSLGMVVTSRIVFCDGRDGKREREGGQPAQEAVKFQHYFRDTLAANKLAD